jgi:DNA-directed RNA polymerase subunit P
MSMSEETSEQPAGIMYECISCGQHLTADQLAMTPEIKCPFCGYRVLRKARPPIVKRVKAR